MNEWIPAIVSVIPSLVAIGGLWWKITSDISTMKSNMATKQDLHNMETKLQADIREIRQMLFTHISNHTNKEVHNERQET